MEEGKWSFTPPPACDGPEHRVCVPPAWGEKVPGNQQVLRLYLGIHAQPLQLRLPPVPTRGPGGENPLLMTTPRAIPQREELVRVSRRGRNGVPTATNRGRGRARGKEDLTGIDPAPATSRGRGRRRRSRSSRGQRRRRGREIGNDRGRRSPWKLKKEEKKEERRKKKQPPLKPKDFEKKTTTKKERKKKPKRSFSGPPQLFEKIASCCKLIKN